MSGAPLVVHYSRETMGALEQVRCTTEDRKGRLLVGADGLLVFDGTAWTRTAFGDGFQLVNTLQGTADGRVIAGGLNELGYFDEMADGRFVYRSLMSFVPPEHREVNIVWGCAEIGRMLVYFCKEKVLVWDGERFHVWRFPTATRLFPVPMGDEWWFTHNETGLYRMTAAGPQKQFPAEALPPRAAMWLGKDVRGLLLAGSNGLFVAGKPAEPLWSPEAVSFTEREAVSSVHALKGGGYLVTSLTGLGVISPQGELVRVLRAEAGLPAHYWNGLRVDHRGQAWVPAAQEGLFRFDVSGALSVFPDWDGGPVPTVTGLVVGKDGVFAATQRGIFHLARAGRNGRFDAFKKLSGSYLTVELFGDGLLLGMFARAEFFDRGETKPIFELPSTTVNQMAPSRTRANRVYIQHNGNIAVAERGPEGEWKSEALLKLNAFARDFAEDPSGNLWVATAQDGLFHYDLARREYVAVRAPENAVVDDSNTLLAASRDHVFGLLGSLLVRGDQAQPEQAIQVNRLPFLHATQMAANSAGTRLYVIFARQPPAGPRAQGMGVVDLDQTGQFVRWTEYDVGGLAGIDSPTALALEERSEGNVLWIGGTRGVMRLAANELKHAEAPLALQLSVVANGSVVMPNSRPTFAFADHHLAFRLFSPEITRRDERWFQTRLGESGGPWSPASRTDSFEFTRLSEGQHTFAVRALDPAGRVSAETAVTFRILPPWWRSPWAFATYAVGLIGFVLTFVKVRERRLRQHSEKLERTVELRTGELIKANAAKDEFLSSISHEIRNPLNGVVGLAAGIDPQKLDSATRTKFNHLRNCAEHLSGMLEDILDFSKLEAGAMKLNQQVFNLHHLVYSLFSLTSAASAKAGVPLDVAISPSVPQWVEGDPARIRQILLNFVINALHYAGRGEVLLTVWSRSATPERVEITFAVSDDGPGISQEEQGKLFTRFSRGDAAKVNRVAGSGIGLAVCRSLAEQMKGRLWVESEVGSGATFHFAVPLPVAQAPQAVEATAQPSGRWHALVVDDEEYNLVVLMGLLEPLGFRFTQANSMLGALAAARSDAKFDAVFLDFNLPDGSGPELTRTLRSLPGFPAEVPIVATTAFVEPGKHEECLQAGMSYVLTKPLTVEKIIAALTHSSDRWKSVSPIQVPAGPGPDPLAALRLLVKRKGTTYAEELSLFWRELETEVADTSSALVAQDPAHASQEAHKLAGRFAFIHAAAEEELVRRFEKEAVNGAWPEAGRTWARLTGGLEALRSRLSGADRAARGGSDH
ncbi:MAG: ATP-binding protein [Candidatus Didemnitutus sp.]|nr:ATP-binding protein [Candidatus Didemnitutus sp.]